MQQLLKTFSIPKKRVNFIVINLIAVAIFTFIYWLIGTPEHFAFTQNITDKHLTPLTALYYAFGTQLTMGYGDIIPHSNLARIISMFQYGFMLCYLFLATML